MPKVCRATESVVGATVMLKAGVSTGGVVPSLPPPQAVITRPIARTKARRVPAKVGIGEGAGVGLWSVGLNYFIRRFVRNWRFG